MLCDDVPPLPPGDDDAIFEDFPWLDGVVDREACEGTTISVYEQGIFTFLHIQTTDSGVLYFQDGTLYCTDGLNFDCVAAYALGAAVDVWECEDSDPGPGLGPAPAPDLFEDFPFLSGVVDLDNCEGTEINVYEQGVFSFIHIQTTDTVSYTHLTLPTKA